MNHVAIFARVPVVGEVKTRLSPALPPALAAELYRAMLEDTLEAAAGPAWSVSLYWAAEPAAGQAPPTPAAITSRLQQGADLGERLAGAFAALLSEPEDRAVAIGADCPDLDAPLIGEAFAALEGHDLVLGPARDGGYCLIGLRRPAPALFEGVSWGTDRVLGETLERAERCGLKVRMLDELGDIDTPDDLVRLIARRSVSLPGAGRRTETTLREMGLLPPRR